MSTSTQRFITLMVIAIVSATASAVFAQNATPDYYKCTNRTSGEWNYGRAPAACDANAFGSDSTVLSYYPTVVFYDQQFRNDERSRYVDEMNALTREAAKVYAKKRNPNMAAKELENWMLLVLATASHESYWSHYRIAEDKRLKMMRGDVGHGHGLMQVDDRWHYPAVQQGIAWNLVSNVTYGMDQLYAAWERAPLQACVKKPDNYLDRIRASWSAYNGGPSKICRWTNPKDPWAKNDENFLYHLTNQQWLGYVKHPDMVASVDVPCLMEKRENCAKPTPPQLIPTMKTGVLYRFGDEGYCLYDGSQLICMNEFRDSVCLNAHGKFASDPQSVQAALKSYKHIFIDRHEACKKFAAALSGVGEKIELKKAINLRATPGGGLLDQMPANTVTQVLDFEVRNKDLAERYYKVNYNNKVGWIYAGSAQSAAEWTMPFVDIGLPGTVARKGERIRIVASLGINLRDVPDGNLMGRLAKGQIYTVEEVVVNGTNNAIYYRVTAPVGRGFIYSGQLLPTSTVSQWTQPVR